LNIADCAKTGTGQGGTFHVDWVKQDVESGALSMLYDPGTTHEVHRLNCPGVKMDFAGTMWSAVYAILHRSEKQPAGFLATAWTLPAPGDSADVIAHNDSRKQDGPDECNNAACFEMTTMTLTVGDVP
jgi:hypothetical protein